MLRAAARCTANYTCVEWRVRVEPYVLLFGAEREPQQRPLKEIDAHTQICVGVYLIKSTQFNDRSWGQAM